MTDAQKRLSELRARQSTERQRMAELAGAEELTDETRSELDKIEKDTPDLERQIRAAMTGAATEEREATEKKTNTTVTDPELRERVALRSKATLTGYMMAAMRGGLPTGAEAELQAAAGVTGIPIELFDVPQPEKGDSEGRAIAAVPGTVGVNLDPIRPAVFSNSIATRLGIAMPRVESGSYATATISTSQTAEAKAKSAAAVGVAGAMTVTTATPKRISARLELTIEDIAAVGQANFESALRENLSLALSDQLDDQVINGSGTAPNLAGFFSRITAPTAPPTGIATFDLFAAAHAAGVDGLWANDLKEVAIICGPETYRVAASVFQTASNYKGEISAAAYAMKQTGGLTTNKRMPDKATHVQQAILYRMGRTAMGAEGAMRTAVCPHWNEIGIDDIYTGSAKGERYFTLHVLLGDVILVQPDAYARVSYRVSA